MFSYLTRILNLSLWVLILRVRFLLALALTKQVGLQADFLISLFFKGGVSLDCWSYCEVSGK